MWFRLCCPPMTTDPKAEKDLITPVCRQHFVDVWNWIIENTFPWLHLLNQTYTEKGNKAISQTESVSSNTVKCLCVRELTDTTVMFTAAFAEHEKGNECVSVSVCFTATGWVKPKYDLPDEWMSVLFFEWKRPELPSYRRAVLILVQTNYTWLRYEVQLSCSILIFKAYYKNQPTFDDQNTVSIAAKQSAKQLWNTDGARVCTHAPTTQNNAHEHTYIPVCAEKPEIPITGPSNDIISYVCQTAYCKKKSYLMVV